MQTAHLAIFYSKIDSIHYLGTLKTSPNMHVNDADYPTTTQVRELFGGKFNALDHLTAEGYSKHYNYGNILVHSPYKDKFYLLFDYMYTIINSLSYERFASDFIY